jgi:hypothetical protein
MAGQHPPLLSSGAIGNTQQSTQGVATTAAPLANLPPDLQAALQHHQQQQQQLHPQQQQQQPPFNLLSFLPQHQHSRLSLPGQGQQQQQQQLLPQQQQSQQQPQATTVQQEQYGKSVSELSS